ncbi:MULTISPECIES: oligopeptide ABC transporter substrate-binding protein OppA [Citrobacter]|jgi:oligopeptide transport system substrate-binding protein|uniref:Oligopeptide ABC transporter, periplasmic oligopeptide-binding protein OppA (TC 3.A.1.5.1) n=1 Tax=Citrobacter europaeus TaxID=1914243 RepID=A0ABY0JX83_9ENTR|nr:MULTISPECIES: oligopeptide ABC transporter substrate-binding protein OppA [Citrobacter]KDF17912.1 periplasmic oligopeptide-binding protein [Citrobacter freundii MGH 56]MBJ8869347.1 oligopeptide ABC transporter substrate-binding protein OppA [Citrobacter braakii]MBJ8824624.1 oligopeptide ABC transporter substrate-binding protein OppA [Citrobacter freundii]MBJ8900608.1 oligopeptide ABC transporter substrate-binding protein OppA [Citrobacter braakii]MBJ8905263.1 oligopeptide ABC transporter su
MTNITKKSLVAAGILTALVAGNVATAAVVPAGVQLAEKQTLVRNNGSEVQSLDPHKIEGVPESNISRDLFEGLLISDVDGKPSPGVAEKWENKDFKVWTFHLRKDAKWSDGTPVTAQDFVYSWQRLANPNTASPYASYLQYGHIVNIDDIIAGKKPVTDLGVKALDDHTFEVTLSEPVPYFYKLLVHSSVSPVPKAAVEKYGEKWTQPANIVTNGAYKLKDWVVNERIVLERNANYWDNAKTVINQVTYLPIASEVTDVNRYRSGEIDMTYNNMPIELFQKLKKEIPNEVHVDPYLCTYYYEINNQKAPFNDVRVRTALKLAMDRDIIVNKVKNQGDLPAYSFTPPYTDGAKLVEPEWFKWSQEKRNEEAKKLLAEAGYTAEKPLTFDLLYNTSDLHKKLAIAAASIWKKNLGANVKLENQEWKTFLDTRHQGNYDVSRAGWCADYNEPTSFLNMVLSDSSNNTVHYKSPAFDKLIADTLKVTDEAQRSELYSKAEQQLDKDSAIVPVYYYVNARLVKPWVGGYSGKDPMDNIHVKDLYIIKH